MQLEEAIAIRPIPSSSTELFVSASICFILSSRSLSVPPQSHGVLTLPQSHPDLLTSYASYLRELYTSMSHSHTSQHWTHLPRCEFIQLAMIGAQGLRRGGPEEEMIILAQQGKIETILSHKEPIELHNLFLPPPLVVLPPPTTTR